MLDSRSPPHQYKEEETRREEATSVEVDRLLHETNIWRIANSAQWVAWGIVQAKIPGFGDTLSIAQEDTSSLPDDAVSTVSDGNLTPRGSVSLASKTLMPSHTVSDERPTSPLEESTVGSTETSQDTSEEEEFDYLAYAKERAMFFWGDVLQLGIISREQLPAKLLENLKIVNY